MLSTEPSTNQKRMTGIPIHSFLIIAVPFVVSLLILLILYVQSSEYAQKGISHTSPVIFLIFPLLMISTYGFFTLSDSRVSPVGMLLSFAFISLVFQFFIVNTVTDVRTNLLEADGYADITVEETRMPKIEFSATKDGKQFLITTDQNGEQVSVVYDVYEMKRLG